jgi:hypothetical protein
LTWIAIFVLLVRLVDEGVQALFYDLLDCGDVVVYVAGEGAEGSEYVLGFLYALLDGSADEFCEGFAGLLSLEFGVVCCELLEEV